MTSPGAVDVAWVDVLPSMKRFLPDLRNAVGRAMPAAGQEAGQSYGQGFSRGAVSGVEAAANKLAAARRKEEDAAGRVRVAEAKLQAERNSGRTDAVRLASAEENLARAQRTLDARNEETVRSTRDLTRAQQQATTGARNLDRDMGRAHRSTGLLGGAMGGLGKLVGVAAAAFAGFGLIQFVSQSVASLNRIERINAQTTTVIESTGGAAHVTTQHIIDLTGSLENLTATEAESIQQGANFLLTFTNIKNGTGDNNQIFDRSVTLMNDMARALDRTGGANLDTSKTALQLGKALNDPIKGITALSRVGVSFTEQQKEQIKTLVESGDVMAAQTIILDELAREFGGAGEAFAATTAGKIELAKHALGTFGETITGFVIPTLGDMATGAATAFNAMASGFDSGRVTGEGFQGFMEGVGVSLADLFESTGRVASAVGDLLGPAFGGLAVVLKTTLDLLGWIVGIIAPAVEWFSELPTPILAGATALGAWILLRGPLDAFLTWATLKYISFGATVVEQGGVAAGAAVGLKGAATGLMTALGGPVGIAITGVTIGLGFLFSALAGSSQAAEEAAGFQHDLADALRESKGAVDDNVRGIAAAQAASDDYVSGGRDLLQWADEVGVPLGKVTDALLGNDAAYRQLNTALENYKVNESNAAREGGPLAATHAANASAAADAQANLAALSGSMEGAVEDNRNLAAAEEETVGSTTRAATSMQDYQTQLEGAQTAANEARQATDLLKFSLDILTGDTIDLSTAEAAFWASVDQASGALDNLSGSVLTAAGDLNTQSESGRATQDVLFGIKDSANQLIATMIEQGATAEEANAKDAELRRSFYNTALQMTGSKDAAERLTTAIYGIPEERETAINADTGQARTAVSDFQRQIDNLHGTTVQIQANWANGGSLNGAMRFDFAEGGLLSFWADGGLAESHVAQIAPAGAMRVWAEPETGGESYIPLAPSKRKRSLAIWHETGRILQAYAEGGVNSPINVRADFTPVADFARQAASDIRRLLEPATAMVNALNWARTQVGKPYIWAGVGPAGYDCSGAISAITNVIRGHSPYSRLGSTASVPWPGFSSGLFGGFRVGSSRDTGDGIGHMAGTLLGVNVESAGSVGFRVGGSARGATDPLFPSHYSFVAHRGGTIPEEGDIPAWLRAGERVLRPDQDDYFRRFVDAAETALESSGHRSLIGSVTIPVEARDTAEEILDGLWHRLRVAELGGAFSWLGDD